MPVSRSILVPITPTVISDALALVTDAGAAARASDTQRTLAWRILASARGRALPQRRRQTFPDGAA